MICVWYLCTAVLQFESSASGMSVHLLYHCSTSAAETGCRRCSKTPERRLY